MEELKIVLSPDDLQNEMDFRCDFGLFILRSDKIKRRNSSNTNFSCPTKSSFSEMHRVNCFFIFRKRVFKPKLFRKNILFIIQKTQCLFYSLMTELFVKPAVRPYRLPLHYLFPHTDDGWISGCSITISFFFLTMTAQNKCPALRVYSSKTAFDTI